jgi:type I restriction enzyme R subunit
MNDLKTNYMPENWIERCTLDHLKSCGFSVIQCEKNLPDGTGRSDPSQVILPKVLLKNLCKRYPDVPKGVIKSRIKRLCFAEHDNSLNRLRQSSQSKIKVKYYENGRKIKKSLRLIDFDNPENNSYTVVSQMWISHNGKHFCRPDVILFINGLPFVIFELKNNYTDVRVGYDDNLTRYKSKIPHLFCSDCLCVVSNGVETRFGSPAADYDELSQRQLTAREQEYVERDRKQTWQSLKFFIKCFCKPNVLVEYFAGSA